MLYEECVSARRCRENAPACAFGGARSVATQWRRSNYVNRRLASSRLSLCSQLSEETVGARHGNGTAEGLAGDAVLHVLGERQRRRARKLMGYQRMTTIDIA